MKRLLSTVLLISLLLIIAAPEALAQDYKFRVDRNVSHVIVNQDGSADIEYALTFTCASGAHTIDIVDIGLPNSTYNLSTAKAWYSAGSGGGQRVPLSQIYTSEVVDVGVEVHLGQYEIKPGQQGTVYLRINVVKMVYPDSKDENYASVEFAPTWYEKKYTQGSTYMEINFHFPPGLTNEETRYHDKQFDQASIQNDRIVFTYIYPEATGYETHKHGISFPRKYVDTVNPAPLMIGNLSVFEFIEKVIENVLQYGCFVGFGLFVLFSAFSGSIRQKRRKMKYLPPSLAVEGVGIKRGLTAVEAAILLETPLNKVLTMILFSVLKKKGVIVHSQDPLKVEAVEPKPQAKWRDYEDSFLESIKKDGTLDENKLQKAMIDLIKGVNKKLKGFSRKETIAYYKSIVDRAWKQVQSDATPEVKSQHFDQGLEWMMMDKDFEERTNDTFRTGPVFMPSWWAYYRPWRSQV
ncbi:MAG: hypothetical protein JXA89_21345, partial [Anaerolineae bacterium]|nr:hypothetical protein [Anaerolineae bacterium]